MQGRWFRLLVLCLLVGGCASCRLEEDIPGTPENTAYVNGWIWETLTPNYYWNQQIPLHPDRTVTPDAFFESLLYRYHPQTAPDGDRFSWIEAHYTDLMDRLNGVNAVESGLDYSLYFKNGSPTEVVARINYVKKNTPAQADGWTRGMFFDRVGGVTLTKENYKALLPFNGAEVALGVTNPVWDSTGIMVGFTPAESKVLRTVDRYAEHPVYLDTVYERGDHRVGYLVYHLFASDDGSGDERYNLDLNAVFGRFQQAGITDLVLDLRYNSGGKVSAARLLASEIVPNVSDSLLFTQYVYNPDQMAYFKRTYGENHTKVYFATTVSPEVGRAAVPIHNVGALLQGKLYVLTSSRTASASEMVVNGLKAYLQVELIGDTTYGKDMVSRTYYDVGNTGKNQWGMQPIVARYFNSLGKADFSLGFPPDVRVSDGGPIRCELGDTTEPLLAAALRRIEGLAAKNAQGLRVAKCLQDRPLDSPAARNPVCEIEP
jgi:C-terminal processing protease CtpA/Prc